MKPCHAFAVKIVASAILGATFLVAFMECQFDFSSMFEGSRLIAKTLPFEEYQIIADVEESDVEFETEQFLADWLPVAAELLQQPVPPVDSDRSSHQTLSGDEWLRWNAERAIQISQRQAAIANGATFNSLGTEIDSGNVYAHTPRMSLGVLPSYTHQLDNSLSIQAPLYTVRFN
ncbi:hypothetical protein [Lignipirellula cremea]|uniref:Uncharacterized protein n=1 Tax=Lignipirellula cremea TaxID=2528010 RepID=A0A518E2S4_9BACT|nr:hypothetical protein [Lignipirellula cremea]QDU98385.1 hypothetical protein Pla8534_62530 [Lignipirellula cremea]